MSWLQFWALVMVFRCGHTHLKLNPEKVINHDHNYRHRAPSCILPDHLNSHQRASVYFYLPAGWCVISATKSTNLLPSPPQCFLYLFTNTERKLWGPLTSAHPISLYKCTWAGWTSQLSVLYLHGEPSPTPSDKAACFPHLRVSTIQPSVFNFPQ